jgi:hypothetical protein
MQITSALRNLEDTVKIKTPATAIHPYEVAPPESYDAFHLGPLQPPPPASPEGIKTAAHAAAPETRRKPQDWKDEDAKTPKVKPEDADMFEAPKPEGFKSAALEAVARENRAVWIVHGMGQQIPFETVDSLARGLIDAVKPQVVTPRLRTVKIGNEVLQRVELDIDGPAKDGNHPAQHYELHLYETYWAPKTEGVAKLSDVISFLWDGGLRGILNSATSFKRAMFGGMAMFYIRPSTPVWLCSTLLVLVALTIINGVVLAAAAAQTGLSPLASFKDHWCQLSALASCMIAVAFSLGAVLFAADMSKPQELSKFWRGTLSWVGWIAVIITGLSIVATAVAMTILTHLDWDKGSDLAACSWLRACKNGPADPGWIARLLTPIAANVEHFLVTMPTPQLQGFATIAILLTALLVAVAMMSRAFLRSAETRLAGHWWLLTLSFVAVTAHIATAALGIWVWLGFGHRFVLSARWCFLQSSVWVWPFLILFTAKVREIMVQYVGDVAIYVRPNMLDRFDQVRTEIKEAARTVAAAVFTAYKSEGSTEFLYSHVAIVGHSLGSVIAYDTLNRLMLDDWLAKNALGIAERTKTMVTFGSPLNKTAFLFTIQGSDSLRIRERLASTVQPLILSYPKFRKLRWINVYSPNDIISGDLKFYDLPGSQDPPIPPVAVQNVVDPDAAIPLIAHVSYWSNKTVWRELLSEIAP